MTEEEIFVADAYKFKDEVKRQFIDYRSKFRNIMNEVREVHYGDFAKIGIEKEQARV